MHCSFFGVTFNSKGPVTQAQMQGLCMDREQFQTFARVLRDCRFWTVQNSASCTDWRPIVRINVFLTQLTPLLRDPYADCTSRTTTHNPSKLRKTRAKVGICSRSIRNPSVWPVWPDLKQSYIGRWPIKGIYAFYIASCMSKCVY